MAETTTAPQPASASTSTPLPRVAIQFCTQCKWMLRAAYVSTTQEFAQELLSTFGTSIGEVALQPSTGGTFNVTLTHQPPGASTNSTTTLWDRKTEGGFPETKELKRRLRDVIQPDRDLGHVDRKHSKPTTTATTTEATTTTLTVPDTSTQQPPTLASDALATAPTMTMPSSVAASDVVSQLKKHPANAGQHAPAADETRPTSESKEQSSPSAVSDAARDAIGAARANNGQQAKAEISPAGQLPGQQYDDPPAKFNKEKCEDCA
ncbi:selT/selW/selH seleno protein domain-containing protein [Colletotrichum phormii]|uniref:SelT/selW/selH seleno protein domain-containing protein n=1 Tax=Colletotrichum phormii TaxID=359342 RepID=A0AAJ0EL00_9PEZI|nr:selT/selW/selH seleno protein domain-containing protein [Colletotrichum phormii]KAK1640420.1 selT/selW/selH seleno protein domain-containing protein [Colletotrichum phormii]